MKFVVMTLFPDMIRQAASHSVLGRAVEKGLIGLEAVDIRDYSTNNYHSVDDYPFGGGAGMVMQAEPVYACYADIKEKILTTEAPVILMSPGGRRFDQKIAWELSGHEEIVLLCGHYEGIDQRVIDEIVTDEISIGDYVLTGGELPAMVIMDTVSRLVEGVLGNSESAQEESFSGMWLEYPQYSRPRVFRDREVPEVLTGGNHAAIRKWRLQKAMEKTLERRPDLIDEGAMTKEEAGIFKELKNRL
ncbi:MAG: tRNA (guanosine(37)-N1)-methyltransferase TrmD [Lachnospiraceae bacterium]|nr:tRNA (guanosine(37)-N1)-methyltransferase TrmD [Lachnospiraceae bacterium]